MDFKRMLGEKKFYIAVFIAFLGIVFGASYPEIKEGSALQAGTFLKLAAEGVTSQTVLFVLPAVAALPCAEEYLRERQWNFLRFLIVRKGRRQYCRDRVLTAAVSGALVWGLATLFAVFFFFLLFFGKEELWSYPKETGEQLFAAAGRVCLAASAFSSFAAACAVGSASVYLALGLPFITCYACVILRERYMEKLYCIDPSEWLMAKEDWGVDKLGLWLFLLLLAFGFAALHNLLLQEHLREI